MNYFKIIKKSKKFQARCGIYQTSHAKLETPFFMPVATQGAVKHISTEEIRKLNSGVILANTYHLMLRPGEKQIKKLGGLHKYIDWQGAILTDSGGFQVFSLAGSKKKGGESLVKITKDGVKFKSYIDGHDFYLTPEKSLQIQIDLGVDMAVCLDECVALPAKRGYLEESVAITSEWAARTKKYLNKVKGRKPLLHAVIQGGLDKELRLQSLNDLVKIGFDGYNIGGLSVGESSEEMYKVLDYLVPSMPDDKPRYLMGVGYPENIVEAVKRGVDMFDCVIPTREGRHGRLFLPKNSAGYNFQLPISKQYETIIITNARYKKDKTPINKNSTLPELRNLSKSYLNYLFNIKEPLGLRLASLNNLEFYLDLMQKMRLAIKNNKL